MIKKILDISEKNRPRYLLIKTKTIIIGYTFKKIKN